MNQFRIEATPKLLLRFWDKVEKLGNECGCWLWMGSTLPRGYGKFGLTRKEGWKLAHRVSFAIHFGPFSDSRMVLHTCDTPGCVRPDHLFLGDHTANMKDQQMKGRVPVGRQRYNAKLSADLVRKMRQDKAAGKTLREISHEMGIGIFHASSVVNRKKWRHVE